MKIRINMVNGIFCIGLKDLRYKGPKTSTDISLFLLKEELPQLIEKLKEIYSEYEEYEACND